MADQDQAQAQAPPMPTLCVKNCGFYGNPSCMDMCSKCYKEFCQVKDTTAPPTPTASVDVVVKDVEPQEPESTPAKRQRKKNRCFTCSKKIRLAQQFSCRCELVFCSDHRYADAHQCTFDYKSHGQEQLKQQNPAVISAKLNKI